MFSFKDDENRMELSELEKEEKKEAMLEELQNNHYDAEVDEDSSYEEIEDAYNEMIEEYEIATDAMFPNGQDLDADNFDD